MQLMCDAISVLGGKHGIIMAPAQRKCRLVRFDRYEELPDFEIRAGVIVNGREIVLPLTGAGDVFGFIDQRMSCCSMSLMGVDPESMLKLKLTFTTPFRPEDGEFSTTPVIHVGLRLEQLPGGFRWETRKFYLDEAEIFIEIKGDVFRMEDSGPDSVDLCFTAVEQLKSPGGERPHGLFYRFDPNPVPQRDRLVALNGSKKGNRFVQKVTLKNNQGPVSGIDIAWCAYSDNGIRIKGERCPFKYTGKFKNLDAVAEWARQNPEAIPENAKKVEKIVRENNLGLGINRLLDYTLHSWLVNTLWTLRGGKDFFSVWEGSCYFQSTVDVEYTQAPLYFALWPGLLKMELDQWPEFSADGTKALGEKGKNTLFQSHDIGSLSDINGQDYPHDMEVEETVNYIILSYLYWRRTGDFSSVKKNLGTIEKYLAFLSACDTTGNGVPDQGAANTIDDGSPAIQFGKEQVYLAMKTLSAYEAAADMFDRLKRVTDAKAMRKKAGVIRKTVETKGWLKDHYAVLLDKSGAGTVHPWTGEKQNFKVLPGWDSEHLFTENAVAMMSLVGKDLGLDRERMKTDIRSVIGKTLREYGCRHSSYEGKIENWKINGFVFNAYDSSWISSNMVRDIAAFYLGIDLRYLADRYWEWQTTVNSREMKMYFESFNGNNVNFYPRGVAVWGYLHAIAGIVIDKVRGVVEASFPFDQVRVPKLWKADWKKGTVPVLDNTKSSVEKRKKRKTLRKKRR